MRIQITKIIAQRIFNNSQEFLVVYVYTNTYGNALYVHNKYF